MFLLGCTHSYTEMRSEYNMFSPIILAGKYVTQLQDIDNDAVNSDVLKRQSLKLDDDPGHTFAEDSYYPDTPAC